MMPTEGLASCHELLRDTEESDDCASECRTEDTDDRATIDAMSRRRLRVPRRLCRSVISPYGIPTEYVRSRR